MISIALASHNGAQYIGEQIDSILAQSYQDFELIICDDCSTDNTWQILQEYARKDNRIKIFKNEKNLGFKKNFEKAISHCNGEYIALCDQDDVWMENHLEVLINGMKDYSLSCANSTLTDKNNNDLGKRLNQVEAFYFFEPGSKYIYRSLLNGNSLQGANMLMPKEFLTKCLPIPEKVLFHDAWFAACACLDKGINYTFDIINNYRQHGENITFSGHNNRRSFFQKLRSRLSFLKNGLETDRFCFVDNLKEKYGFGNDDFAFIYHVFEVIKSHKLLRYRDIKVLWRNYHYIKTAKTHKGFLDFLITLHLKKPIL